MPAHRLAKDVGPLAVVAPDRLLQRRLLRPQLRHLHVANLCRPLGLAPRGDQPRGKSRHQFDHSRVLNTRGRGTGADGRSCRRRPRRWGGGRRLRTAAHRIRAGAAGPGRQGDGGRIGDRRGGRRGRVAGDDRRGGGREREASGGLQVGLLQFPEHIALLPGTSITDVAQSSEGRTKAPCSSSGPASICERAPVWSASSRTFILGRPVSPGPRTMDE